MNEPGQLTYASFDAQGAARGGWQVKQAVGLPPGVTPEQIVDRVVTTLDAGVTIPAYPTAQERQHLPRRVLFAHLGGYPAWWSSVPAGPDASGRQGNVFTHVVVGAGPSRPAALVASPGWLTPFGAAEVAAATVGPPPAPVDLAARAQYFLDNGPGWPLGTLGVLADAVAAALTGGPVVAVLVESSAEAAEWLGALSLCCSAQTGAMISFATLERAANAASWAADQLNLVFLPRLDAEAAAGLANVVVIDPLGEVEVGEPGGRHQTGTGQTVTATEWSALVMDQLGITDELPELVTQVDWIAAQMGDSSLPPAWPLAMRAALGHRVGTEQVVAQALIRTTPDRVAQCPALYEQVLAAIRDQMGDTTAQRWSVLAGIGSSSAAIARVVALIYAEAAVADLAWLAQPGEARLPSAEVRPALTPEVLAGVGHSVARLSQLGPVDSARAGIHLLGLLEVLGWLPDPRLEGFREGLLDVVLNGLRSPQAAEVIRTSGTPRPGVAATIEQGLRLTVMPGEGALGGRVAAESLRYLGLSPDRLDDRSWLYEGLRPTALAAEVAIWVLRDQAGTEQQRRMARYLATDAVLREGLGSDPHGVAALLAAETFTSWELGPLVRSHGAGIAEEPVLRALLREPDSNELEELAANVKASSSFSQPIRDVADLRSRVGRLSHRTPNRTEVEQIRSAVSRVLGGDCQALDQALVGQMQVGSVVGLLRGESESPWIRRMPIPTIAEELITKGALELQSMPTSAALVALTRLHPRSPELTLAAERAQWLGALKVATGELLVLERLVLLWIDNLSDADLYRLAEQTEVGRADRFLSRWLQKNRPRSVRDRIGGFFGAER